MNLEHIKAELLESSRILTEFISNEKNIIAIDAVSDLFAKTIEKGNKIISCGNGGSMTDAMHFAEELSGRYRNDRKSLPAIAISDSAHITCTANDYGFEHIFSRFIEGIGNKGDVLLAISTSGNSPNIINACESAKAKEMHIVGLTGKDGGKLANLCDVEIRVPHFGYSDRIQEIHIKIIHVLINTIEKKLNLA